MMPIEFHVEPGGRVDLRLGAHVVGTIRPQAGGVRYSLALPGIEGARQTDSVDNARRVMLHVLADWFAHAGLCCTAPARAVSAQAEQERPAA